MKIPTARLTLRRWREDDAEPLAAMHADAEVTAWLARGPMTVAEAYAEIERFDTYFDTYGFGPWAVESDADRALIGVCGLRHENRDGHPMAHCVEIEWRQARVAWGHGYMAEAAAAALADGFHRVGLAEVFAWTAAANLRSQRVMQRIGMQRQPTQDFDHPALAVGHPLRRHVVYVARRCASD